MTSIQLTATVSPEGKLIAQLPPGIEPGEHQIVLVIDEAQAMHTAQNGKRSKALRVLKWNAWPANSTFRREELYGDEGR